MKLTASQVTRMLGRVTPFMSLENIKDYIGQELRDDGDVHVRVYLRQGP